MHREDPRRGDEDPDLIYELDRKANYTLAFVVLCLPPLVAICFFLWFDEEYTDDAAEATDLLVIVLAIFACAAVLRYTQDLYEDKAVREKKELERNGFKYEW